MFQTVWLLVFFTGLSTSVDVPGDNKIVGGYAVNITNYPYQLSLRNDGGHICGASIISKDWGLTAAHCVTNKTVSKISFRAGSTRKDTGGIIYPASQIIIHPNYVARSHNYDFALVKVSPSFDLTKVGIKSIKINPSRPVPGTNVVVTGWGTTTFGGNTSPTLLAANVTTISNRKCNNYYDSITSVMLCAWAPEKDACQYDSGGPLVSRDNNMLVGVVSWGVTCADDFPGVYASPPNVREWIFENSGV